jgi:3-dehydroquinate dehydratase/shikimate dehydrogenase
MASLCVTVTATTMAELRARRDAVAPWADLIELRLDGVGDLDVAGALADRPRPVIVTCRPRWEGGAFTGSEAERRRILAEALALGAEYVDVEWRARFDDLIRVEGGRRIVLSLHDFTGMPAELPELARAMQASGAAVVKLAVTPARLADLVRLREVGAAVGASGGRVVVVAMGDLGVPTRVLAAHFGSGWSYAGAGVAPGQLPPEQLVEQFRFRRVDAATAVYGVVGRPLAHSLSPAMHNAAFEAAGLDAVYVPLEAADVEDLLAFVRAFGVRGVSVTAPFKERVVPYVDALDPLARRTGAVNTLRFDERGVAGCNTDVEGFLDPLRAEGSWRGRRAAVIGAGGAARAVVVALASEGVAVDVYARRVDRAEAVARLAGGAGHALPPPVDGWDLLVNATPVGTTPAVEAMPVPRECLRAGRFVYDLVYNPPATRLLREAAAAGCRTLGGLAMLVAQARRQFAWWTGRSLPPAVFERAAERALGAWAARTAASGSSDE